MRISRNLGKDGSFHVFHIENGEAGQKRLKEAVSIGWSALLGSESFTCLLL